MIASKHKWPLRAFVIFLLIYITARVFGFPFSLGPGILLFIAVYFFIVHVGANKGTNKKYLFRALKASVILFFIGTFTATLLSVLLVKVWPLESLAGKYRNHKKNNQIDQNQAVWSGIDHKVDTMDLHSHRELLMDPRVFMKMRVTSDDPRLDRVSAFYLRCLTFDRYVNKVWQPTKGFKRYQRDDQVPWLDLPKTFYPRRGIPVMTEIRMAAKGDMLPSLFRPRKIRMFHVKMNSDYILRFTKPQRGMLEFTSESLLPMEYESWKKTSDGVFRKNQDYKKLTYVPDEVKRVLPQIELDPQLPLTTKIDIILRTLRDNYIYSLAPFEPAPGQDPIDFFVNEKKSGFCVHFASVCTMMMRDLGVPARMVQGYRVPNWGIGFSEIEVRNADAHAWCEILTPDAGWIVLEPTPGRPGLAELSEEGPVDTGLEDEDITEAAWMGHLKIRVQAIAGQFGIELRRENLSSEMIWLLMALFLLFIIVFFAVLIYIWRHWTKRIDDWTKQQQAAWADCELAFYREFLSLMAEYGHRKQPSMTVREYSNFLTKRLRFSEIQEICQMYEMVHDAGHELDKAFVKKFKSDMLGLKAKLENLRKEKQRR